jgi:signal transduction histidine kinase
MKNSTKMALFSTGLLTAAIIILYMVLITEINAGIAEAGLDFTYNYLNNEFFIVIVLTLLISSMVSTLLIDQILNPVRVMILKLREIEKMKFSAPLVILSEDEELKEYVSAFNSMSRNVHGYIERQKRFISDASHELTTPITVINGHADMLRRRWREQPELLDGGLGVIQTEILRMSELADSLLLLARSDSGKQNYTFKTNNLNDLINESVSEAALIAPEFTIETALEEGLALKCDAYAIRRVLRIILTNAIKYSENNKYISITAHSSHGLHVIAVKDHGIGINSEHLPFIFDRFYRADDSRTKKTGSSGLGLAIAKEIIAAHGGDIEAESEEGKWTEFRVIFPS